MRIFNMNAQIISRIYIEKLFGLYTYDLPEEGEFTNAAILYGDNGVGKSTVLRMAFHLLSAASNRSHRTALYETEFASIEVRLSSGIRLSARVVQKEPAKILLLEIAEGDKTLAVWEYQPKQRSGLDEEVFMEIGKSGRHIVRMRRPSTRKKAYEGVPWGEEAYLKTLNQCVPTLFILNADRRLDSDSVADPSDEVELRRTMQYEQPKRINELVVRSREIALSQALSAAGRWLNQKAVIGTNRGSMNVHSVYADVLKRLVSPRTHKPEDVVTLSKEELVGQLTTIDTKSAEHARYEMATRLETSDFRRALNVRSKAKLNLAIELLQPYVKSVQGRLEAIEPIYQLVDRFVSIINSLLRDKSVLFTLSQGFIVQNSLGMKLNVSQLSSGEQQLLLLFCYVLIARDRPTVFMIDEPEISLNVKWQRQLVQSLLDISHGESIQFVFASHSMELLAQHRNRVVRLVNKQ
jgi:energy-coupling factor transporter ATP-binding protein EcfA2